MAFWTVLVVASLGFAAAAFIVIRRAQTEKIVALAEKAAPAAGRFVEFEGCRIHLIEQGEGRAILFLHGLGGWAQHLSHPLFPLLDGFRLIAVDRPGSGRSTRPAGGPETISDQAAYLVRLAGHLGLDRPLIVGHSMGGAIALRMALDFPGRIAGLALVSPLTRHEKTLPAEFRPLVIPIPLVRRLVADTISAPMAIKNTATVLDFVFGPQHPPADYGTTGAAMAALRPDHFYAASTDATALKDALAGQEKRYGELTLPVGIVFGDADRALSSDHHGAALAGQIRGLDLEILTGVGHMPQYAEPERVAAFIRRMAGKAFAA